MAVIREDVVSIGFEVANNPFSQLTKGINDIRAALGILDTAADGLRDVGREANQASNGVEDLANSIHAPPTDDLARPIEEAGQAAGEAGERVSDLTNGMQEAGDQDLTRGVNRLTDGIKKGITGFKDMLGKAKTIAKEKLDAGVAKLPPLLQVGVRAGGKLLEALGKVAKLTFKAAAAGLKSLGSHAAGAAKAVGGKVIKGTLIGITAASTAMVGLGVAAVTVGAGFEASMSQVAATMGMTAEEANYSNETYAKLANTAKEMGATTKFSASESAEALNYMALAGYDADKACAALPTVLNLAASGGMELAAASDMVTDSMSALGIEATTENLTKFGDQLAKTSQKSNTSVAQLGEAVLTVGGTAKNLAGGTTELNTLLGIIADNGVKGAEGGTALRNIMLSLQTPTDIAAKKMKSLGLNVYDAEGKMRPMNDVLTDLTSSMDGMSDQKKQDILSTIFNKRDLKSVNALLSGVETAASKLDNKLIEAGFDTSSLTMPIEDLASSFDKTQDKSEFVTDAIKDFGMTSEQAGILFEGLGAIANGQTSRFDELSGLIDNSSGAMADMADTMNDNLLGRMTEFKSASEGAGVAIYEALGSSNLKNAVKEASGWMTELTRATEAGGLDGLVQQLGTTVSKALVAISNYMPQIVQAGVSIIQSLLTGIIQNKEQIVQNGLNIFSSLLMGILQMAPQFLTAGIQMLGSTLQGLEQQMPMILQMGLNAIQNLCAGLLANAPAIIQSGINLIMQLLNGLIAAAPTILTTGIQLVIMLAQGLIGAIPQLIQAIPQIVSAIITTFMSVDWLKLGLDIIKGIGSGLVQGIKGLFSKGKDAGKEVGDGVAAGLDESTSQLTAAADTSTTDAVESFKPNTDLLSSYGMQMPAAVASGMESNASILDASAEELGNTASASLNLAMGDMLNGTQPTFAGLSDSFTQTLTDMDTSATTQMGQMDTAMQTGFQGILTDATTFGGEFKSKIDQIDLYQSGADIMRGLDKGLNSMRSTVVATAQGIASDIKSTVNTALDIHSPSRVMEESGEYTGLGLVKGMENLTGKITRTAQNIADQTARRMSPMQSRYSPDSSAVMQSNSSSQVNNYSPVFNLTLNGASASDSNARKVKRWVKSAMNEAVQGMGRTSLRPREV